MSRPAERDQYAHSELTDAPSVVLTAARVRTEREAQRIRAALRNALREVLLLARFRLGDLALVEVALVQLLVESLQIEALDDIDRVDDVTEGLGHLATMRITDHRVAVHLREGDLAGEVDAEEYHTRHPEEENVPARLEDRRGVEELEVVRL